jgi:hypothetical protein
MLMPPLYSRPAEEPGLIRLWPLPACSDEKSRNVTHGFSRVRIRAMWRKRSISSEMETTKASGEAFNYPIEAVSADPLKTISSYASRNSKRRCLRISVRSCRHHCASDWNGSKKTPIPVVVSSFSIPQGLYAGMSFGEYGECKTRSKAGSCLQFMVCSSHMPCRHVSSSPIHDLKRTCLTRNRCGAAQ